MKPFVNVNLTGGLNTDGNLDSVEVALAHNVVSDPDGNGMRVREGSANFQRISPPPTTPAGGIVVGVNSMVPNLNNGNWLVTCCNTTNNNSIDHMALTTQRSSVSGESLEVRISFNPAIYFTRFGAQVIVKVRREGAINRQVRVNYQTVNGSAVAGTDYVAATGQIVFAAGDVEETITITTTAAGQTTDKSFTVTLSGGSSGVTVAEPSVATITCQILSLISSFGGISVINTVWPLYLYNPIAGRCTAHYLRTFASLVGVQQYGLGSPIVRVTPNVICAAFGQSGTTRSIEISLYSMSQIFSDGAAYQGGTIGGIALATKHSAYANFTLIGNSGTADSTNFWIVPYTTDEFFVVSLSAIWRINVNTGAVVTKFPVPTHDPTFTTWTSLSNGQPAPRPFFGLNGDLYVFVQTMNSTTVRVLLRIHPDTGTLVGFKTNPSGVAAATGMTGLADGNIIVIGGGAGASPYRLPADLSTTTLLTGTYGEPRTGLLAAGGGSWLSYADDSDPFSFRKFSHSGSTVVQDFLYPSGPPFNFVSGDTITFQGGLVDSASFAARYGNNNGVNKVGIYKLSDGTVATGFTQIDQQDFYGAEGVGGSLFGTNTFTAINGNDQADINLYYQRQIAGLMK